MNKELERLRHHHRALRRCTRCIDMTGPAVRGNAVLSRVLLIGQAPGAREIQTDRPFAWTAGKTLFRWFSTIGLDERRFRERIYMAAVCRCFPGKNAKGGDRVPTPTEIANCSGWLEAELSLLKPRLILPVGKLAIAQLMPVDRLQSVIGASYKIQRETFTADVVPLPHPSGASTWHRMEPGKFLLKQALGIVAAHPAWQALCWRGH